MKKYKCDDCETKFSNEDELDSYKDFWSRIEIGCEMPAGDCPKCGAFVYIIKNKKPPPQCDQCGMIQPVYLICACGNTIGI
jgi:hypothetical protein